MRSLILIGVAYVLVGASASAEVKPRETVLRGRAQGTTYSIKFWAEGDRGADSATVQKAVEELLARIDRQMSTWRGDSEVSRFNRAPVGEWFDVSAETALVVGRALDFHRDTGGALDVTVGPLVRLWGFGAGAGEGAARAPTGEELRAAMARVGAERLHVRRDPPALRKDTAGLEVDLSGIAPGYTVDALVELLHKRGIRNIMVELGGEVRAVGVRPDGRAWRIGVESPASRAIVGVVPLKNLALTTAGDSHNVREIEGVGYTHIIDPRRGAALPYRGTSVTVLAETAIEADALDTALMVMGTDAGYEWCVKNEVAALFQSHEPKTKGIASRATPQFEKLLPDGLEPLQGATAE